MPPRKGLDGEQIYLLTWQHYISRKEPDELAEIFRDCVAQWPTQRMATVAASFIAWLGTNVGHSMVDGVEREAKLRASPLADDRYLLAWESANRRRWHVNRGMRLAEFFLADHSSPTRYTAPEVTIADLDVIDSLCLWLATPDGRAFIRAAQARLAALRQERRLFQKANAEAQET